ncbi:MDR family MFS transporter [Zavarzinia compransoris]|uniref:MFS transporter n=1 Tax=Zavarzinia compransoris TaxID=1264899 RepID=A0A317EAD5_9PROT|nr:MDR family MFS transporter [Zavarzinia compransoris]PWR23631.1 MFS transporter [Zavarzinia compransoris]TDP47850.1 EmrB/QacA subfamily drug resistance transporter [Zavarzinia compransoris]
MTTSPDPAAPRQAPDHRMIRRIIAGIMLAMFLGALDQTIVTTALPTIGREMADAGDLAWVVTAYLLSSTAVTPLYGKLSDVHGRRAMLLIAITVFVAGSVACALAPDMLTLILMRGVQGLGGGGLISLAQTIIADLVSPKERSRYQGYIAGMFGVASVGGPVLGGLMAEHLHWTMIFWINLPLGILAFAMTDRVLRRLPRHDRRRRIDYLGAALMVVAAASLLLALTWGGVAYPWGSPRIVGLLALSALFWAVFAWRIKTADEPFLPLSVLADPVVRRAIAAAFFAMGTMIGLCLFMPIYIETVLGHSAATSGLMLIAFMGGTPFGAMICGRAMARMRHYKRPSMIGLAISAVLTAVLALFPRALGDTGFMVLAALIGGGIGTALPLTTVSIQNAVPIAQMGTATGAMNFFRALGSALIVSALSAVFFAALGDGAPAAGQSLERLAGQLAARGGDLGQVFTLVFGAAALGLAVALGFVVAMETKPLRTSVEPNPAE